MFHFLPDIPPTLRCRDGEIISVIHVTRQVVMCLIVYVCLFMNLQLKTGLKQNLLQSPPGENGEDDESKRTLFRQYSDKVKSNRRSAFWDIFL